VRARVIFSFLMERRTPSQIEAASPDLAGGWSRLAGARETTLYGRPLAFHWQAQAQDWAGQWTRVRAPVLAMSGEFDWFEDAGGIALIGDLVNRARPGAARVEIIPGLDHHFRRYPDRRAAFREEGGAIAADAMLNVLLPWLAERGPAAAPKRPATSTGPSGKEPATTRRMRAAARRARPLCYGPGHDHEAARRTQDPRRPRWRRRGVRM
jgi:hypothetical protein